MNGSVSLGDFVAEALTRQDILELTARVTPVVDPEIERGWGRNVCPTRVEAVMDGAVASAQVNEPRGGPSRPMSAGDMRRKLEDCLAFGGFGVGVASRFEDIIEGLADSSDVAADIGRLIAAVKASAPPGRLASADQAPLRVAASR